MARYLYFFRLLRRLFYCFRRSLRRIKNDVIDTLTVLSFGAILLGIWYVCFFLRFQA